MEKKPNTWKRPMLEDGLWDARTTSVATGLPRSRGLGHQESCAGCFSLE